MATSLGFRLPQFSEDAAWLPNWLQHPEAAAASIDQIQELLHNNTEPPAKDLINSRENGEFLFTEEKENGFKCCALFLSGEDTDCSNNTPTPAPPDVLHFHLHLSSDVYSSCSQRQLSHTTQVVGASGDVVALHQVETSSGSVLKDDICQTKQDHDGAAATTTLGLSSVPMAVEEIVMSHSSGNNKNAAVQHSDKVNSNADGPHPASVSVVPASVEETVVSSATTDEDGGQLCGEKSNAGCNRDADINDAVELSIAASEALVIHEVLNTMSASDILPVEAIVEAALRVKQARLEVLNDTFFNSSSETSDRDLNIELHDVDMVDAFVDVGLNMTCCNNQQDCGSDISQVKDTPLSELDRHNSISRDVQLTVQKNQIIDPSAAPYLVDQVLYQPAEDTSNALAVVQPQLDANSLQACNEQKDERFRSRWFGGWTAKARDASIAVDQTTIKSMPKFFVGETSFLSESAEDAPDQSSFVQRHNTVSSIASQSSVHFQGLNVVADEGVLISEDIGFTNLSLVDPLCSAVPCTLSSQNTSSPLTQNQNEQERCLSPKSHIEGENLWRTSDLNAENTSLDWRAATSTLAKYSRTPFQKLLTSRNNYQTTSPRCDSFLELGRQYHGHLPLDNVISNSEKGCFRLSDKSISKDLVSFRSILDSKSAGNSLNQDKTLTKCPVSATMCEKSTHDECGKDKGKLHTERPVQMNTPVIQNRKSNCRLTPSNFFVRNFTEEKNTEHGGAQENRSHNFLKPGTKSKACNGTQNHISKRVRFSEVEVELGPQVIKDLRRPQNLRVSTTRNKRTKCPSPLPHYQNRDAKSCFKRHIKDVSTMMFLGLEILLTGYSGKKKRKLTELVQQHGGIALSDIPSPPNSRAMKKSRYNFQQLPLVISPKKLQTLKFLYGCAVNAPILKLQWLNDSIRKGSVLPPEGYMILPHQEISHWNNRKRIFDNVGIMLLGRDSFCTKLTKIVRHGGGQVFRTLQRLSQNYDSQEISFAAIVTEEASRASRHLSQCAKELNIPIMPASWIVKSLHSGKLLSGRENPQLMTKLPITVTSSDWSEEI